MYGRVLRDFIQIQPGKFSPRPEWRLAAEQRAAAFAKRHLLKHEQLQQGTKQLPPLLLSDQVAIQDQTGKTPRAWTKTGTILEVLPHHSYLVRVDGSNHVTKRNRQFIRKIVPFSPPQLSPTPWLPTFPTHSPLPVPVLPENVMPDPSNNVELVDVTPNLVPATEPTCKELIPTRPKSVKPAHLRHKWVVNPAMQKNTSVDQSSLQPDQVQLEGGRGHH